MEELFSHKEVLANALAGSVIARQAQSETKRYSEGRSALNSKGRDVGQRTL
jgi:hypothetical protein